MKNEPLQPNHGEALKKFAFENGLYFDGWVQDASKDDFFKIWWCFHDMKIKVETKKILERLVLCHRAHVEKIMQLISGYEQGTVQFSQVWEGLGWAVAWYYQSKIS